jgi:cation diffusion facilitator family transporter
MDRQKILIRTSWVSVCGNALLSLLKVVVGVVSGSIAVLSDGLDTVSDVVTSLIILLTARIVSRPPTPRYVFGRSKAENMASTVLSFVIFFMGCQIVVTALRRIVSDATPEMPSLLAIWVTVASIGGKLLLAWYQFVQGKRCESSMLKANAINMRNDVVISVGVLAGLACTFILKMPILDSIIACLIGLYIAWTAIGIFREANIALMDGIEDTTVYRKVIEAAKSVPGAYNPHRIRSSRVGNLYNIVLDIEVEGTMPLSEAHLIAQKVENSINAAIDNIYDVVVHIEPKDSLHCAEKYGVGSDFVS